MKSLLPLLLVAAAAQAETAKVKAPADSFSLTADNFMIARDVDDFDGMSYGIKAKVWDGARMTLGFADATPDVIAYPATRPGWGRLTRLLTRGNRRAEKGDCILHFADLADHAEDLLLIAMAPGKLSDMAALAPGYEVSTVTTGGSMFGYSRVVRRCQETKPTSTMTSDSTVASTGRRMHSSGRVMERAF